MERIVDYLAQEETQQQAKRVKMTEWQKVEYEMYRAECKISNVEPVLRDFLAGDIPDCVTYQLELQLNEMGSMKAFAASA